MWEVLRHTGSAIIIAAISGSVFAQSSFAQSTQQVFNSQQFGFNLPRPPIPNGFDEVRAADGTSCRSSIAGNGAYLDFGGIGAEDSPGSGALSGATIYGRVTVPLGAKPNRIDCSSLYQLELERLQHELNLAKAALRTRGQAKNDEWNNE
jgi:hypothetical protein